MRTVLDLQVGVVRGARRVAEPVAARRPASTWVTSVDLPDPDTPVTAVSTQSGNVDGHVVAGCGG